MTHYWTEYAYDQQPPPETVTVSVDFYTPLKVPRAELDHYVAELIWKYCDGHGQVIEGPHSTGIRAIDRQAFVRWHVELVAYQPKER